MIDDRNKSWFHAAALLGLAACVLVALVPRARGQSATAPQYTSSGELQTPSGFETWVFVGSNLGLGYKDELAVTTRRETVHAEQGVFHNIYINPEAYAHFVATHEFPDPTVLVMEVFTAADNEPKGIVSKGVFDGERVGLQVAVKDSHSPAPHGRNWAYYIPQDVSDPSHKLLASSPAFPDAACESCHQAHASLDNVWVQFYPTLRKLLK
jgi:Cytochrome P460